MQRYHRRRRPPHWVGVTAATLVLLLVIGSAGAGFGFLVAKPWALKLVASVESDLQTGATELQVGTDDIHKANVGHEPKQLDEAKVRFDKSRSAFLRATSRLQREGMLTQAERVPVLGTGYLKPRLALVGKVSAMGVALDDAGQDTADLDRQLLAPANPNLSGGQRLIAVLQGAGPGLAKIGADLDRAGSQAPLSTRTCCPGRRSKAS